MFLSPRYHPGVGGGSLPWKELLERKEKLPPGIHAQGGDESVFAIDVCEPSDCGGRSETQHSTGDRGDRSPPFGQLAQNATHDYLVEVTVSDGIREVFDKAVLKVKYTCILHRNQGSDCGCGQVRIPSSPYRAI